MSRWSGAGIIATSVVQIHHPMRTGTGVIRELNHVQFDVQVSPAISAAPGKQISSAREGSPGHDALRVDEHRRNHPGRGRRCEPVPCMHPGRCQHSDVGDLQGQGLREDFASFEALGVQVQARHRGADGSRNVQSSGGRAQQEVGVDADSTAVSIGGIIITHMSSSRSTLRPRRPRRSAHRLRRPLSTSRSQ